MRKTLVILLALAICVAVAIPFIAEVTNADMKIAVEFKSTGANKDDVVTALVSVKGYDIEKVAMAGLQYELSYAPANLEFVSAQIDTDFYDKTVQFWTDETKKYEYASYTGGTNPYFSVDTANGKIRFVSIAEDSDNGYESLGKNFTMFTVTFKVISESEIDLKSNVKTPEQSTFNLLGSPTDEQGETIQIDLSEDAYVSQEASNAIKNLNIDSVGAADITVKLYNHGETTPVKTLVSASITDIYNVDNGTYDIVISKPHHLSVTVTNVPVTDVKSVVDLSSLELNLLCGDVNDDGYIDPSDLSSLVTDYLKEPKNWNNPDCDLNKDGYIDPTDLSILVSNYLKAPVTIDYSSLSK